MRSAGAANCKTCRQADVYLLTRLRSHHEALARIDRDAYDGFTYLANETYALDARVGAWVLSYRSDPDTSATRLAGLYDKCLTLRTSANAMRDGRLEHLQLLHERSVPSGQRQRRYEKPALILVGAAQSLVLGGGPGGSSECASPLRSDEVTARTLVARLAVACPF
jgi:hypothetical protein